MKKSLRKEWCWALVAAVLLCVANIVSGKDADTTDGTINIVQPADKPRNTTIDAMPVEDAKLDLARLHREEVEVVNVDLFANRSVHPAPPPPSPAVAAPSAPPLPFTYIGKMIDGDVVTVFLAKQNQDYNLKLNDVVDNTYRIEQIGDDRVVITYLPLDTQQTLNIGRAN